MTFAIWIDLLICWVLLRPLRGRDIFACRPGVERGRSTSG